MFASITPFAGHSPFGDWFVSSTVQAHPLGTTITAVDSDYWGQGKFVYLKSAAAIVKGSVVVWDDTFNAVLVPNTANQGFPVGTAMYPAASGNYFWAQVEGLAVYVTNATVAADTAIGITAAGTLGTLAAGKQILNCRNRFAATKTVTVGVNTQSGTNVLFATKGYAGFPLGVALTGTGIPASTVVAGLDPDGKRIYMGSAIGTFDKTATATGLITLTGTYTGYGAGIVNNPFCQGAIT